MGSAIKPHENTGETMEYTEARDLVATSLAEWYSNGGSENADAAIDTLAEMAGYSINYDEETQTVTIDDDKAATLATLAAAVERLDAAMHDGGNPEAVYEAAASVCTAYFGTDTTEQDVDVEYDEETQTVTLLVLKILIKEPYGEEPSVTVHRSMDGVRREIDTTARAYGIDVNVTRQNAGHEDEYGDVGEGIDPNVDAPWLHWSVVRTTVSD
jgi:hypothetical protein